MLLQIISEEKEKRIEEEKSRKTDLEEIKAGASDDKDSSLDEDKRAEDVKSFLEKLDSDR